MSIDPDLDLLPPCEMLEGFEAEDRRLLSSFGRFIIFEPDHVLIREGHDQDRLYLLLTGALNVVHEAGDGVTPVGAIAEGEWFGEINIFDAGVASATVVAKAQSQVWYLSRTKLEAFLNAHPELGCQLILCVSEVLARRVRGVLEKLNATWEISG